MKTLYILLLVCGSITCAIAQNDSIVQIMQRGIDLHDQGKYEMSLIEYRKALAIEPKNAFVNYEMALSYYYMGNKSKAESHAKMASKEESETGVQGVILLGSIYDEQGNSKKSVKVYRSALKRFGDYYLIWFNLGVTYQSMGELENAADAFMHAAENRLDHVNSHYALGSMKFIQGKRAEAMMALYFFLMLEPDTERSVQAATSLNDMWAQGISQSGEQEITITLSSESAKDPFQAADMMISILQAGRSMEQYASMSELEFYEYKTSSLFKVIGELDFNKREDFITTYYVPLFNRLANSEHMTAFVHFTNQSIRPESEAWVNTHTSELEAMFNWLDETSNE